MALFSSVTCCWSCPGLVALAFLSQGRLHGAALAEAALQRACGLRGDGGELGARMWVSWRGALGQQWGWRLGALELTQLWLWDSSPSTNHTGVPTDDKTGWSLSAKPLPLFCLLSSFAKTAKWMLWELIKPSLLGPLLPTVLRRGEVLLGSAGCCRVL